MTLPDNERDYSNHSDNETFQAVLARRLNRRSVLKGALAAGPLIVLGTAACEDDDEPAANTSGFQIGFEPVTDTSSDTVVVPTGYTAQTLIQWGDALFEGTSRLATSDLGAQSAANQEKQFGYNNDFIGYFPLKDWKSNSSTSGLLAVNHEYTNEELMFPKYDPAATTREIVDVALAAHGMTIVEIEKDGDAWAFKSGSKYNRRLTGTTEMILTGPAAGHDLLKTSADPTGASVLGMLNNCAAGKTPWGTVLTAEENFNQYFSNAGLVTDARIKEIHARYGLPEEGGGRGWESFYDRFDLSKEPNEPFRFGWMVEIDPYDASSTPKKRTALGRNKHEAGTIILAKDNRVVVYSGDDERFDYMYKFISNGKFNANNRAANMDLLDDGTLYVAKFNDDGTGQWLPLVFGQNGLTADNGFASQADILINTRGAGDVVGATKMDRPEDIEASPTTRKVYALMTNNTRREPGQEDPANPRAENAHGHVIELTEDGDDNGALSFLWGIFLLAGDPSDESVETYFAGFDKSQVSPISCPDNCVFGANGTLWLATDGMPGTLKQADGVFATTTEGPERGWIRRFLSVPKAAECCGPEFTPDFKTLFIAVQHPGEAEGSTLEAPVSMWPNNEAPPRPSVVAITKTDGGMIGT